MDPLYKIRSAAADDAEAIRAIRNDVIAHSTAMWTTRLLTPADGQAWLAENLARRSCYVVEASGAVIGFANWGPWRPKDGYRHTVEDSLYLFAGHQGRGVGAELLRTLIAGARESGAHVMMACIEATNAASIALHARQGFELVGTAREVGFKFGRWLDLSMMRLPLVNAGTGPRLAPADSGEVSRYCGRPELAAKRFRRTISSVRLDKIAIIVDDYDRAIRFFTNALGFDLVEDSPAVTNDGRPKRWVVVRPPGGGTGILLAEADGERQEAAVGNQFAGRVGFFLEVDDFDAAYRRMTTAGVEFISAPRTEPYGRVAVFADIAGNHWDLLSPPPRP